MSIRVRFSKKCVLSPAGDCIFVALPIANHSRPSRFCKTLKVSISEVALGSCLCDKLQSINGLRQTDPPISVNIRCLVHNSIHVNVTGDPKRYDRVCQINLFVLISPGVSVSGSVPFRYSSRSEMPSLSSSPVPFLSMTVQGEIYIKPDYIKSSSVSVTHHRSFAAKTKCYDIHVVSNMAGNRPFQTVSLYFLIP